MSVIIKSNFALGNSQGLYNVNKFIFDVFKNNDNGKIYKVAINVYLNNEVILNIDGGVFCTIDGVDIGPTVTILGDNTMKFAYLKIDRDGLLEINNIGNIISLGSTSSSSFFTSQTVIDSINATSYVTFNVIQMNDLNSSSSTIREMVFGNIVYLYGNAVNLNKTNVDRFSWNLEGAVTSDRDNLPQMYGEVHLADSLSNLSIVNVSQFTAPIALSNIPNSVIFIHIRLNKGLEVYGDWADLADSNASSVLIEGNKKTTISGSLNDLSTRVGIFQTDAIYTGSYTARSWGASFAKFWYRGAGLTTQIIDQLLIDLSEVPTWNGEKSIRLKGTRSAASNDAVSTLVSKGVTVSMI